MKLRVSSLFVQTANEQRNKNVNIITDVECLAVFCFSLYYDVYEIFC